MGCFSELTFKSPASRLSSVYRALSRVSQCKQVHISYDWTDMGRNVLHISPCFVRDWQNSWFLIVMLFNTCWKKVAWAVNISWYRHQRLGFTAKPVPLFRMWTEKDEGLPSTLSCIPCTSQITEIVPVWEYKGEGTDKMYFYSRIKGEQLKPPTCNCQNHTCTSKKSNLGRNKF